LILSKAILPKKNARGQPKISKKKCKNETVVIDPAHDKLMNDHIHMYAKKPSIIKS
jgi:hypothetical protein